MATESNPAYEVLLSALLLGATFTCFCQWTNLNSGINDKLNDVYFRYANNGIVAGSKGIYYTTSGGSGASSWTRFAPSNPSDLALYNRCKFLKIAPDPASAKTYICGIDTVNAKAIMFYYKSDDGLFICSRRSSQHCFLRYQIRIRRSICSGNNRPACQYFIRIMQEGKENIFKAWKE